VPKCSGAADLLDFVSGTVEPGELALLAPVHDGSATVRDDPVIRRGQRCCRGAIRYAFRDWNWIAGQLQSSHIELLGKQHSLADEENVTSRVNGRCVSIEQPLAEIWVSEPADVNAPSARAPFRGVVEKVFSVG